MSSVAPEPADQQDLRQWVQPVKLVVRGVSESGAQLIESPSTEIVSAVRAKALGRQILEELRAGGVRWVYAVPTPRWSEPVLTELGFRSSFDVVVRNFYLGLSGISTRLDDTLEPFRRVAKLARRIRQKLIEVDFDATWVAYAARLFELRRSELGLAIDRSEDYLRERYANRTDRGYRLLVLRRQAGVGIDGYAVVRLHEPEPGQTTIQLIDHWTRVGERRSTTWLLGELAMWGLAEQATVIQAFAAAGSVLEHVLIGAGCIRKPLSLPFMIRSLAPGEEELTVPLEGVQLRAGDLALF